MHREKTVWLQLDAVFKGDISYFAEEKGDSGALRRKLLPVTGTGL